MRRPGSGQQAAHAGVEPADPTCPSRPSGGPPQQVPAQRPSPYVKRTPPGLAASASTSSMYRWFLTGSRWPIATRSVTARRRPGTTGDTKLSITVDGTAAASGASRPALRPATYISPSPRQHGPLLPPDPPEHGSVPGDHALIGPFVGLQMRKCTACTTR